MRIGVISASRIPSRAANSIQVMKVCQAFLDVGHTVRLWVPGPALAIADENLQEWYGLHRQIQITWVPGYRELRRYDFAWRAVAQAKAWKADLIYCWPLQAAALSSWKGIPTALEVHDRPQGRLGPCLMRLYMKGQGAKRILPITKAMRNWLAEKYSVPLEEPFCVISPMGVDLEQYEGLPDPAEARAKLQLVGGTTVGYTGHLYEGRGLELMVDLARRNSGVSFLWVGGEPEAVKRWESRLSNLGIENIELIGFVPNERLPFYLAACNILLMPYERHIAGSSGGDTAMFASPMKAFEYMASGRAILTSDLPVLREVLDEEIAVLLAPEDIEGWDQALKELIGDPDHRARLGKNARARVDQFSWTMRARRSLAGLSDD